MNKLYIVMPSYNEEGVIAKVVDEWHAIVESVGNGSKLAIFNDGSKDNTVRILENIKNKYPDLIVINKQNTGHGPTCTFAYKYAVAENADWIFQTDSDGQTKSSDFWHFWEKRSVYDFIIGYRAKRGDGCARRFISRTLMLALFVIFNVVVKDANTPFRLMKVDRLRRYIPVVPDNFFLPNTLLTVMITKNKENILWQEITFAPRTSGISSIPLVKIGKLAIALITQLYKMKDLKPLK
ncbi:MAG: glycosyltransferase family 2 protein [Smithella sp.]